MSIFENKVPRAAEASLKATAMDGAYRSLRVYYLEGLPGLYREASQGGVKATNVRTGRAGYYSRWTEAEDEMSKYGGLEYVPAPSDEDKPPF